MNDVDLQAGWPFLVARGRRHGYRPLLVPGFLAECGDLSVLNHVGTRSPAHRQLATGAVASFVFGTHLLRRSDLDGPAAASGESDSGAVASGDDLVLDHHGRPLELLYGLAFDAPSVSAVAEPDLRAAGNDAIATHQRFLADEDSFEPVISEQRPVTVIRQDDARTDVRFEPQPPEVSARLPAVVVAAAAVLALIVLLQWPRGPSVEFTPADNCGAVRPGETCQISVTASDDVMLMDVVLQPGSAPGWTIVRKGADICPRMAPLPRPCTIDVTADASANRRAAAVMVDVAYLVGSEQHSWTGRLGTAADPRARAGRPGP